MFFAAISGQGIGVGRRETEVPAAQPEDRADGVRLMRVPSAGGAGGGGGLGTVGANTLTDRTGVTLARAIFPATRARGAYTRYLATVPGLDGTAVEKAKVPDRVDFLLASRAQDPAVYRWSTAGHAARGGSLPEIFTVAPESARVADVVRLPEVGVAATAACGNETATETATMTASEAARSVESAKIPPRVSQIRARM